MDYNGEGFHTTHKEALEWVKWYAGRLMGTGVTKQQAAVAVRVVLNFLSSGADYINELDRIVCPACQGRKHIGVSLTQGGAPEPCSTCDGDGWIEAPEEAV